MDETAQISRLTMVGNRRRALLDWGTQSLRDLPWRQTRDPWSVWVSEIMLQQTQVDRVIDRHQRFLRRFPTVAACASVAAGEVIDEWSGLGYSRRAVNLHRGAKAVVDLHEGEVPDTLPQLLALPGVGPYTARAILAFAFERPAAVVDTNVGRVLARWDHQRFRPKQAQARADELLGPEPWLWNQTIMELGALVCTKRQPACAECPVRAWCAWRGEGPDPAVGSAAVSGRQARFEGSDRQLRGRLVERLRSSDIPVAAVAELLGQPASERVDRVVAGLVQDGLVSQDGDVLRLP